MAVPKLESLRTLAELLADAAPDLADNICEDQSSPWHELGLPSLAITEERSQYMPDQEDIHHEPSDNAVVLNVGRHVQELKLRLGADSSYQRAVLEQQILDLFLEQDGQPGILSAVISRCVDLGPFLVSWELESETWKSEKAFSRQLYSELLITETLPALVTRRGVYPMTQLLIGMEVGQDVDTSKTAPDFDSTTVIQINEDGTTTPI